MNKNIEPENSKGQDHGYHEWYYNDGNRWLRVNFKNGKRDGYREAYWDADIIDRITFYIL